MHDNAAEWFEALEFAEVVQAQPSEWDEKYETEHMKLRMAQLEEKMLMGYLSDDDKSHRCPLEHKEEPEDEVCDTCYAEHAYYQAKAARARERLEKAKQGIEERIREHGKMAAAMASGC